MNFGYRNTFFLIDKGNIEVLGPLGLAYWLKLYSKQASNQQSGLLPQYTFVFVISLFFIVSIWLFNTFDIFELSNTFFCLVLGYFFFLLVSLDNR